MARVIVISGFLALLAACASKEPASPGATAAPPATSSAPQIGDNQPGTYTQPVYGPERRVEPPPPPRRQ